MTTKLVFTSFGLCLLQHKGIRLLLLLYFARVRIVHFHISCPAQSATSLRLPTVRGRKESDVLGSTSMGLSTHAKMWRYVQFYPVQSIVIG